jgi:NADPH:quinone reductase-like Zn-dependent oxidoreductase
MRAHALALFWKEWHHHQQHTGTPSGTRMRTIVQDSYGSSDVLRLDDLPRPDIKDDQVLVRVHAAGLDRGTWHLMTGTPYAVRLVMGLRRPKQPVPGRDVAGIVEEVGAAVTRFAPGDEVFGMGDGTFAEYAAVREDKLALKPANLSFEEAAVVSISAVTALRALTEVGHVAAGQRVLVTGSSGGVGSYAVQLANAMGAEVTGEASTAKLDFVRSLGASHVVDYTKDDFADGSRRYDLIVDVAGNPSVSRLRRALTPTGTAVIVGGEGIGQLTGMGRQLRALLTSPFVRQRLAMVISKEQASDLEALRPFLESGQVRPSVDQVFALDQAPEAMRRLETGQARGKIAISIVQG